MTIDLVPTGTGFVNKMQRVALGDQFSNDFVQRLKGAVYSTVITDLTIAARLSDGDLYGILMDIHTDKCAILFRDLPPMKRRKSTVNFACLDFFLESYCTIEMNAFIRLMKQFDVAWQPSNMSFSVKCLKTGLEFQPSTINSLFAQRRNALRPWF